MDKISTIASSINNLLQNPTIETQEQNSDRVSATTTANAGNIVQSAVKPGASVKPVFDSHDPYTAMAYDPNTATANLAKLVIIGDAVEWTSNQIRGTKLKDAEFPKDLAYPINMPGHAQAIYFSHIRTGYHICVQVNAAMGFAGSLIVVYLPNVMNLEQLRGGYQFESYMNLPHVIINLATTTQGELFIPYTSSRDFIPINTPFGGRIGVYVWTQLRPPAGAPASLSVTVLGSFVNPNYQCPKPPTSDQGVDQDFTKMRGGKSKVSSKKYIHGKFKWTRELINIGEGPGSMNLANRLVTNGAQSVALSGERAVIDPRVAGTSCRIKDLKEILQIPSCHIDNYAGLWNWPIGAANKAEIFKSSIKLTDFANFKQMANGFTYYRGSVNLHISIFASTFNRGRLRVCFFPLMETTNNFNYDSCRNAINMICDIGLNSEFKMKIPFTSETWMKPLTDTTGRLAVFVENKLTYSQASPNSIDVIIAMSAGDDFQLYIPTESIYNLQGLTSWGSEMDLVDPVDDSPESIMQKNGSMAFESSTTVFAQGEEMAAEVGLASTENKGPQDRIIRQNQPKFLNFESCKQHTMMVSHSDVDNFFGRAARVHTQHYEDNSIKQFTVRFPKNTHLCLAHFFAYFAGEVNFHFVNQSSGFLSVSHTYDQQDEITDYATSNGAVLIPPMEAMTICAPFYSKFALREVRSQVEGSPADLGVIRFKPEALSGTIIMYMSLRNPNFIFPMPAALIATSRDMLTDPTNLSSIHTVEHAHALIEQFHHDPDKEYQRPHPDTVNPMAKYILERTGYRYNLLKQCGDVELNPGPYQPFRSAAGDLHNQAPSAALDAPSHVVYRNRGFYRHYGIEHGGVVYHLTSENIADSALNGTATFTKTSSDGWTKAFPIHVDYFTANNLEGMVGTSHIFACDSNCETIIRDLFPATPWITQSQALGLAGGIILCATTLGYVTTTFTINDLKEMFVLSQQGEESAMHAMVQRCMNYFSNIFIETFASDIIRAIVKCAVRLLCYVVLYCHAPNLLTTMCLGTLIIMDVQSSGPLSEDTKGILKSLVEGDIRGFAEAVVDRLQFSSTEDDVVMRQNTIRAARDLIEVPLSNEGPADFLKGFNTVSQSGKHIEWWLTLFKRVYEFLKSIFAPSENKKALDWLEGNEKLICDFLSTVNNHLTTIKRPEVSRNKDFQEQHIWLCRRLNDLCTIVVRSATHSPLATTIVRLTSEMHRVKLPQPSPVNSIRVEPVGVWICGEPGQGKSFLTQVLIKKISKKMGYVGVFTNPTGSEFMDGYSQQEVHVIDDAGQNRDEPDLKLLCQCISSIPFTVPMADLNEKGMPYTSKLVIATSNRSDFTSTVLSDPGALKRRFPFYLRIRAKQQYIREGKIDVPSAMSKMALGDPWEVSVDGYKWESLDVDKIVDNICSELDKRSEGIMRWRQILSDQGPVSDAKIFFKNHYQNIYDMVDEVSLSVEELCDQFYSEVCGADSPFECLRMRPEFHLEKSPQSIRDWFLKKIKSLKDWAQRNVGWLTLVSIFATGLSLIAAVALFKKKKPEEDQRPYNPQATNPKGGKVFQNSPIQPYVLSNEAPYNSEIEHLFSNVCYITAPEYNGVVHCLALKGRKLVTYGHVVTEINIAPEPVLIYKGYAHKLTTVKMTKVSSNGQAMDLVVMEIPDLPFQFKDITKYFTKDVGNESYMLWSTQVGRIMYPVDNPFLSGVNISKENTVNAESVTYSLKSKKGMCGGVLITKIGGNFKILGMHISGNGVVGCSAMLYGLAVLKNEGLIVSKEMSPVRVFQPSKTTLHANVLHGTWPVEMGPAVTSPHDPRLEIKEPSIIKKNVIEKYPGNVFKVDKQLWEAAVTNVAIRFQKVLGVNATVDMETAIIGMEKFNKIDLNTSAGLKYSCKGITKKDLIKYEPLTIHPTLVNDVTQLWQDLRQGKIIKTTFATYMKDELRKICKIKNGSTRLIEACSLDYVVVHRMVMCQIYAKIYDTPAQILGCAVGINPWTDFDMLVRSLYQFNYCFDFSKWDGSLSPQLLEAGSFVLSMCHEEPQIVMDLMRPIIHSEQVCMDEINYVEGGMPSGAPCTTVLNSVCNVIICEYVALKMGATHNAITYGDDLVFSSRTEIDSAMVCNIWKTELGLTATAADKTTNVKPVHPLEIEFLKRKPKYFENTGLVVGALDLQSMIQHIMWSKSDENFHQQLVSFENELVLHGKEIYTDVYDKAEPVLSRHGIHMTSFDLAYRRMIPYLFQ